MAKPEAEAEPGDEEETTDTGGDASESVGEKSQEEESDSRAPRSIESAQRRSNKGRCYFSTGSLLSTA